MVELIAGVVGGHGGHVEAVAATAAPHHGGVALVKPDPHGAVNRGLGAVDEAVDGVLERPIPEALIHQVGPLLLELALAAQHIGRQGEALELLVGLDQQQQPRGFVDLPALDAHNPVLDHVEPAEAMAAGQGVGATDQAHWIEANPIDAHRVALLKTDLHQLGLIRSRVHTHGEGIDLLGRLHVGVFEGAGLDRAAQQVEVDRIGRLLAHRRGDAAALAVGDRFLPAHAPLPRRREHLEIGGQGADGHIETHLVVALTGAAVGHRIGPHFPGDLHQPAGNQGPGQGRAEGIAPLVESIGPDRREGEFGDEGFDQVSHNRLAGAGIERLAANRLELIPLAQVGGEGDHLLHSPFLLQIGDADAGVHPAGIGQHRLLSPTHPATPVLSRSILPCRGRAGTSG